MRPRIQRLCVPNSLRECIDLSASQWLYLPLSISRTKKIVESCFHEKISDHELLEKKKKKEKTRYMLY